MQDHAVQIASAPLDDVPLRVTRLHGREALGASYRFVVDVEIDEGNLAIPSLMGTVGTLVLPGGRRIHGVWSEITELVGGGATNRYRLVLTPRLWLLSLDRQSRVFQCLSVVDIVDAVLSAAGLRLPVDQRLSQPPAVRDYVVQFRESSLDFLSRLLEEEGIAYHFVQAEGQERLVLCDDNDAYRARVRCTTEPVKGAVLLEGLRGAHQRLPQRLILQDYNLDDPQLPLEAEIEVDPAGFGVVVEDDQLGDPERGAQVARIRAQALRCRGVRYDGRAREDLAAGMSMQFDQMDRPDLLVTSVEHRLDEGRYEVSFQALDAQLRFRPQRLTPRPKMNGLMPARVDAAGTGAEATADDSGRYRVVMPFDGRGAAEGHASCPVPVLTPDEGTRFSLRRGSEIAWTGIDGDPSRPVIAGTIPTRRPKATPHAAKRLDLPNGAILEMSGAYASPRRGAQHWVEQGRLASPRLETAPSLTATPGNGQVTLTWTEASVGSDTATSYKVFVDDAEDPIATVTGLTTTVSGLTNGTGYTFRVVAYLNGAVLLDGEDEVDATTTGTPEAEEIDGTSGQLASSTGPSDWIRFAVPHGNDKWSYLRYGERTDTTVATASDDESNGSFTEPVRFDQKFKSNYYNTDGESSGGKGTWRWKQNSDDASDAAGDDGGLRVSFDDEGGGNDATFAFDESDGILDYTDKNRTEITMGDYQTVTQGHRTDVILGDYRVVIPFRTNGAFDADVYGMRFWKTATSGWRKREWSHAATDTYSWGDTESFNWGFNASFNGGLAFDLFMGAKLDVALALQAEATVGTKFTFSYGDSFEYSKGDAHTESTSHQVASKEDITLTIDDLKWQSMGKDGITAAALGGLFAVGAATAGSVAAACGEAEVSAYTSLGFGVAALVAAGVLTHAQVKTTLSEPSTDLTLRMWKDKGSIGPVGGLAAAAAGIKISFDENTFILLDSTGISMQVGAGAAQSLLKMSTEGIFLSGGGATKPMLALLGEDGASLGVGGAGTDIDTFNEGPISIGAVDTGVVIYCNQHSAQVTDNGFDDD